MVDSFNAFIQKWVTPFTVLTFFGAVVWGVQLNTIIINHSEALAIQQAEIKTLTTDDRAIAISLSEGLIVQRQMVKALERIENQIDEHEEEAEEWKRKILLNEQRLSP